MLATFVNWLLGILTILGLLFSAAILVFIFLKKKEHTFIKFFEKHALLFGFIVALTATLGSLTYSDILHYEPCKFCWFQRIFMYPQVVLFGIALWRKDRNTFLNSFILSVIGGLVAIYHYLLQLGIAPAGACSAVGYSVSCSKTFVLQFGFISIPFMAATAFIMITLLSFLKLKSAEK